jgi:hypothetical protein
MCLESILFKLVTSFILVSDISNNVSDFRSFSTVNVSVVGTSGEGEV